MKKIFIDTNVLIDLIDKRVPYYNDVAIISTLAEQQKLRIAASSLSFVNTYYVLSKKLDNKLVINSLMKYRLICEVSNIDKIIIDKSLISNFNDFEDAVQHYSALYDKCDILITRNKKDFKNSEIPVMTPSEFLVSINKL
ncbi:PIN domain-containing protein [Flavobacterium sp.]|uniref:PIN domain-containing protein n=1 Tax=Flavobacterium sp. TaxID=239 RepID=UPI003919AF58